MTEDYNQLLTATIEHLESLQNQGVKFVQVAPETLKALSQPVPKPPTAPAARPAPARPQSFSPAPRPLPAPPAPGTAPRIAATPAPAQPMAPAAAASGLSKEEAMAELRTRVLACVKCPNLVQTRQNIVFGVGNIHTELMFVGEAPGMDEDRQGEPFVGAAGQLLNKIIKAMGLEREQIYIANILKCRPNTPGQTTGNRKPEPAEMQTCIPYLHQQIDIIKPKVMVALGATAVEGLLGKTGISRLRGNWQTYRGIPLMPTFHPSFLLHQESFANKRLVWEDMMQVMQKLGLAISDKQRAFFAKTGGG